MEVEDIKLSSQEIDEVVQRVDRIITEPETTEETVSEEDAKR